jgi:hypothetical protein
MEKVMNSPTGNGVSVSNKTPLAETLQVMAGWEKPSRWIERGRESGKRTAQRTFCAGVAGRPSREISVKPSFANSGFMPGFIPGIALVATASFTLDEISRENYGTKVSKNVSGMVIGQSGIGFP